MFRPLLLATLLSLPIGARAAELSDLYRPRLHFTAPDDWINDPNGLFRVGPEWHLQFQYKWPRNWGHAKSADLLHWEHLPLTLAPDATGDIWSGCTVRDEHNTSGFFAPGKGGLVSVYASWKKPA
ncbi:MAG TPA: levanase, partial [Chthoniobacter sp.]|nr:levanase [Chthoniobacter sp.]